MPIYIRLKWDITDDICISHVIKFKNENMAEDGKRSFKTKYRARCGFSFLNDQNKLSQHEKRNSYEEK